MCFFNYIILRNYIDTLIPNCKGPRTGVWCRSTIWYHTIHLIPYYTIWYHTIHLMMDQYDWTVGPETHAGVGKKCSRWFYKAVGGENGSSAGPGMICFPFGKKSDVTPYRKDNFSQSKTSLWKTTVQMFRRKSRRTWSWLEDRKEFL